MHYLFAHLQKLNSYKGSGHLEHNISLDYAYVNYTIEIKMRSQRARDEASFWSKPGMIVVASSAKSEILSDLRVLVIKMVYFGLIFCFICV